MSKENISAKPTENQNKSTHPLVNVLAGKQFTAASVLTTIVAVIAIPLCALLFITGWFTPAFSDMFGYLSLDFKIHRMHFALLFLLLLTVIPMAVGMLICRFSARASGNPRLSYGGMATIRITLIIQMILTGAILFGMLIMGTPSVWYVGFLNDMREAFISNTLIPILLFLVLSVYYLPAVIVSVSVFASSGIAVSTAAATAYSFLNTIFAAACIIVLLLSLGIIMALYLHTLGLISEAEDTVLTGFIKKLHTSHGVFGIIFSVALLISSAAIAVILIIEALQAISNPLTFVLFLITMILVALVSVLAAVGVILMSVCVFKYNKTVPAVIEDQPEVADAKHSASSAIYDKAAASTESKVVHSFKLGNLNIVLHIVLTILSLIPVIGSFWTFYWVYRTTKVLNNTPVVFRERPPFGTALMYLFVPFYNFYWIYTHANMIDKCAKTAQVPSMSISVLSLVLAFVNPAISIIMMQVKINKLS